MEQDPRISERWVRPSSRVGPRTLKLSIIDQTEVRYWSSYILCFKLEDGSSHQQTFEHLCQGLSGVLTQFPFLAGQVHYPNRSNGFMEIKIPGTAAVKFGYRDFAGYDKQQPLKFEDYERLRGNHFPPSLLEDHAAYLMPPTEAYPLEGAPVFAAQANFVDGGLLLFFAHAHQVADVTGTEAIMEAWARNTTEAAHGRPLSMSIPLRNDSMNRSRLNDGSEDSDILSSCGAFERKENDTTSHREQLKSAMWKVAEKKDYKSTLWYSTPEQLKLLKEYAAPNGTQGHWISTMDALTALLWRQTSKARGLQRTTNDAASLYFICNMRSRMSPPMRRDTVCNATMKLSVSQAPKALADDTQQSLSQTALAVRQSISEFSHEQYHRLIGFLQSAPTLSSLKSKEQLDEGPDMVATDHSRVGAYKIKWGQLGHINCIRKMWWSRPSASNQCTIMPRLPDGGLEILTTFEKSVLERLMNDSELSRFTTFRC